MVMQDVDLINILNIIIYVSKHCALDATFFGSHSLKFMFIQSTFKTINIERPQPILINQDKYRLNHLKQTPHEGENIFNNGTFQFSFFN